MFDSGELRYDGRVALVTGAGAGLGRIYALLLASRGAKVVVNDLGGSTTGIGSDSRAADNVVKEIVAAGGVAVANYDSVIDGGKLVQTAIDTWGRIDIIVNNAGILRDTSFAKMTEKDWDIVIAVHGKGHFATCRAAWPYMRKQKYGRIVNVTSTSGLFGNFGQSNYAFAKMGIVGLSSTLAKEGAKRNIKVNVLAPGAGSRMTETIMPKEMVDLWKPDYVAPMMAALAHESVPCSGRVFQAGGGWYSQVEWQRSDGLALEIGPGKSLTPEMLVAQWDKVAALPAPDGVPAMRGGTHKDQQMTQVTQLMGLKPGEDPLSKM